MDDGRIPGLPISPTGKSVVIFSQLVRVNAHQLTVFKTKPIGKLPADVAKELEVFAKTVPTLTQDDKKIVLSALKSIK